MNALILCVVLWSVWNIYRWRRPDTFSVVSMDSGQALVLINGKHAQVFRREILWRLTSTGAVLPAAWGEILDTHES